MGLKKDWLPIMEASYKRVNRIGVEPMTLTLEG